MRDIDLLKNLVNGKNPYTGLDIEPDNILRSPEVVKKLKGLIRNIEQKKEKRMTIKGFVYNEEIINKIVPLDRDCTIDPFSEYLSKKLKFPKNILRDLIRDYLTETGMLSHRPDQYDNNQIKRLATAEGELHGIFSPLITAYTGKQYFIVQYSRKGQEYVISLLPEILKDYK